MAVGFFALQLQEARATALTYAFTPGSTISVSGVGTVSVSGGFTVNLGADGGLSGVDVTFVVPSGASSYDDVATGGFCELGCVSSDPFVLLQLTGINETDSASFTANLAFDYYGPDLTADTFVSLIPGGCSGACWTDNSGATYNSIYTGSGGVTPVAAAPEPATIALFGVGLTGLGWMRRRRKA